MSETKPCNYARAILDGFTYLLSNYENVFVIGQGLWAPWYVGSTMKDLEKQFGVHRIIDTPVSEAACTGAAVGASLCGFRPIVSHPRLDFMVLAMDQIVNQAANWSHMFGGQASPWVTVRGIINRGGEQGAQHSQALHAWFAHVPGLYVVMPATPADARDLLISSVLYNGPVLYIDDRWLYEQEENLQPIHEQPLAEQGPIVCREGADVTLVGMGYSVHLCCEAEKVLQSKGIRSEVVNLRVLNPLNVDAIISSVQKTGRLCVVDGAWRTCGMAGEIVARVTETIDMACWRNKPVRVTLPDSPAPTSKKLEEIYYITVDDIVRQVQQLC